MMMVKLQTFQINYNNKKNKTNNYYKIRKYSNRSNLFNRRI